MSSSTERVVAAARALLPELPALLGDEDAADVGRDLRDLLERAERGEPVTDRILELLRSRPATGDRLASLLARGEGRTVASGPPPPAERRTRGLRRRSRSISVADDVAAEPPTEPAEASGDAGDDDAARWILAQVWELADPTSPRIMRRGFRAGTEHAIKVRIGPIDDAWMSADAGAAADSVDARLPGPGDHEVAVIFFVPALGLKDRRALDLPASGPSEIVSFSLPPYADRARVEAWVSVVFEGRHVQGARLSGFALEDPDAAPDEAAISLQWAAIVPGLADPVARDPFDASVWLDTRGDGDGEATVAGVGVPDADDVIAFGDDRLDGVLDDIRALLRGPVDAPDRFADLTGDETVALLRALAFQGRILQELVGRPLEEALAGRALQRVQIVQTDRIDYAPLEFVYDLPTPSQDARLCGGWMEQIRTGGDRCPPSNHPPAERPEQVSTVCPLGFWALSRVIERQVVEARDVRTEGFAVRIAPTTAQARLSPLGSALFGFSQRLDATVGGQSTAVLETLNGVTSNRARVVDTWETWASAISDRPSMLVLLSHTVQHQGLAALEIGPEQGGSRISLIELVPDFVKAQPADTPIVLLLGCDTAVERNEFRSFVGQFLDCGAALVVGTITPVLGEHAAPVARSLIREIASALSNGGSAPGGTTTFGDLMRSVRRRLLAEGELTALSITSFGDADWRLSSGG